MFIFIKHFWAFPFFISLMEMAYLLNLTIVGLQYRDKRNIYACDVHYFSPVVDLKAKTFKKF